MTGGSNYSSHFTAKPPTDKSTFYLNFSGR